MFSIQNNSASLFILYLVISSNFLPQTFSCRLQQLLNSSMIVKHLFGFMTLLFFVVATNTKKDITAINILLISVAIYLWFIISTKMHLSVWGLLIIILGIVYLLQLYESNLNDNKSNDENVNDADIENIQSLKKILTYISLLITAFGFIIYLGEKKLEYGEEFSFMKFIIGNPICKGYTPPYSIKNNVKALVS